MHDNLFHSSLFHELEDKQVAEKLRSRDEQRCHILVVCPANLDLVDRSVPCLALEQLGDDEGADDADAGAHQARVQLVVVGEEARVDVTVSAVGHHGVVVGKGA